MNYKKPLFLLVAVAALALAFSPELKSSLLQTSGKPTPSLMVETKEIQVEQKINFGDGKEVVADMVEVTEGESVLDVLSRTRKIETKEYSFGKLVENIEGVKNGTEEKYWIFYVNDDESKVGAADYKLKEGDKVEWKFKTYEEQ